MWCKISSKWNALLLMKLKGLSKCWHGLLHFSSSRMPICWMLNTRYHSMSWVIYITFTIIILVHVLRIECMMQVCWFTTHHWVILIKGNTRKKEIELKLPDTAANSCHLMCIACSLVFNFNKTTRKLFFGNDDGASVCCKRARHMHTLKLLLFSIISSGLNIEPCSSPSLFPPLVPKMMFFF